MTLKEMGQEYLEQSDRLMERMGELKRQREEVSCEEQQELEARMALLYREALDLRKIGRELCHYYEEEASDAPQALYA